MLTPTHHKISRIIYDELLPNDHDLISRTQFIKGSAAPDFNKYYKTHGHNIPESLDFLMTLIHELLANKHHREAFGFKLGVITHYLADYACTYHANPAYIKKNIAEHLLYEYKIEQQKIQTKNISYHIKYIQSYETIKNDLYDFYLSHQHQKPNPKRDLHDALLLIKRVCDLLIYTYKKMYIIESRKLEHPPRIAIFTDTFYPQINGVSNTLYQYLKFLDFHHIPYLLISPKYKDDYIKVESHMSIYRVPGMRLFFYKDTVIALPKFFKKKIYHILDEFKPTIVHNMTEFSMGHFGATYAKKRHIPYVTNFSTNFVQYLPYYKLSFLKPIAWSYFRGFHNKSQVTFTPSHETKQLLESNGFKHVELFERGIEQELFSPKHYNQTLREKLASHETFLLLYVGRISKEKHIDTLIEVYDKLREDSFPVELIVAGDGPYLNELKTKSHPSITFTGYQNQQALKEIYASSDLFVFPSPSETLGNVVLEAMSSGLPVIGVNAGGVKENIISGYNGYLCPVDDVDAITQKILELMLDKDKYRVLKNNALAHTKKKTWSHVFTSLIQNYQHATFHDQR